MGISLEATKSRGVYQALGATASKFPAVVPKDAKQAIANALKVSIDILEPYKVYDERICQDVLYGNLYFSSQEEG